MCLQDHREALSGADAYWQASLHADAPRAVPRPGKAVASDIVVFWLSGDFTHVPPVLSPTNAWNTTQLPPPLEQRVFILSTFLLLSFF